MKKLNKLFAILVAMAMVLSLGVVSAFAEANPNTATQSITISKKLTMAQGLTAPVDFTFATTPVSVDGDSTAAAKATMPDLGTATAETTGLSAAAGQTTIIKNTTLSTKSIETLPAGSTKAYPHAGTYVYLLKEVEPQGAVDHEKDGVSYDTKSYTLTIVADKDGKVTSVVIQENDDNDQPKDNSKKPGTPDPEKPVDPTTGDKESGVSFENTYKKVADSTTDPEHPSDTSTHSLAITKEVTGDHSDDTKQFSFSIVLNTDATNYDAEDITLTYTKVAKDGTKATADPANFTLADGETLLVDGAPVGTTYTVTENLNADANAQKYVGVAELTETGTKITATTKGNVADAETAIEAKTSADKGGTVAVTGALVGDGVNKTEYLNKNIQDETPPEGILISNLPYIALALVAIGGLVAYVVVRRRNADEA